MKTNKQTISDILRGLKKFKFDFGFDADRDWVVVVLATIIFFVAIGIWNMAIYFSYNESIDALSTETGDKLKSTLINQEQLDSVIGKYEAKRENFEKYKSVAPEIADPGR